MKTVNENVAFSFRSWHFDLRTSLVKVYRVKDGAIVEDSGAYFYEADWDELLNRDDLFHSLNQTWRRDLEDFAPRLLQ